MRLSTSHRGRMPRGTTSLLRGLWTAFSASLWPSIAVAAEKSAGDYFVHSLPGAPPGPLLKMHAGFIEVNKAHNGNMFFWHYQNRHIANRQRTVIWLNGGPGCSSEDGALMEIGPYRVKKDGSLEYNSGSWDEFANVMFVDNPVGTGFSYVDQDSYLHDLPEMADQFITFLEKYFTLFPEYEHDDLYIAGESYAGQHIPYITKAILDRNKKGPKHVWNMKGMLIGNGWISPPEQYMAYLAFAYKAGLVTHGSDIAKKLETQQAICVRALDEKKGKEHVDMPECEQILQEILQLTSTTGKDGKQMCFNMYDVKLKDTYPSCGMNWPPDLEAVTPYLRRQDVLNALNMGDAKRPGWTECNGAVGGAFRAHKSLPSIQLLPTLIEEVPTVLFSGADDLICNHLGTEDLINNMSWNGGKGFELSPGTWAPRREWTFEGASAGIYQEARNLTYVLFYNSSHMVPFDYSRRTRDMLDRFMGVDISSIGGIPTDSRIDGEKGVETSVGGHPNSTAAEKAAEEKVDAAKWHAYYKSGEVALVVVIIAASAWGWFIMKERRKRKGYTGLFGGRNSRPLSLGTTGPNGGGRGRGGLESFRRRTAGGDVEAGDFDESELDELHVESPGLGGDEGRYSVGSVSDDEDVKKDEKTKANGVGNGKVGGR